MPSSNVMRGLVLGLVAGLLSACAMTPEQLAYRDRLELGITTPEDVVRFRTSEQAQAGLVAATRDPLPRYAQALDMEFMQAAATGDLEGMKTLVANGAQVNAIDAQGNSALLSAARAGEVDVVRALLKAGAQVNGRGGAMTPLAAAALRGHAIVVRLLIRNGADVNRVGQNDQSALMNAVKLNRLETAKVLLEAGANTRVVDRNGDNLLAVAVNDNAPDMLALLLQHGVPPDMADSNGLTPLYWADYLNRPALAHMLRDAGAEPSRMKQTRVLSQPYNLGEY